MMVTPISVRVPNAVILVTIDVRGMDVPEAMSGTVAATASCIAIGTIHACDGETAICLHHGRTPATSEMLLLFDGKLEGPDEAVSVFDVESNQLLTRKRRSTGPIHVRVLGNDEQEPTLVDISMDEEMA